MELNKLTACALLIISSITFGETQLQIDQIDRNRGWITTKTILKLNNGTSWQIQDNDAFEAGNWKEGDTVEIYVEPKGYINGQRLIKKSEDHSSISVLQEN